MEWLSRIQIGADIATGITIVGALISWIWKSRSDARKERQRGINDAARTVAVQNIQNILENLSLEFNKIVVGANKLEKRLDRGMNGFNSINNEFIEKWTLSLAKQMENGQLKLDDLQKELINLTDGISNFYELIASSRYVLFPSLSVLPESEEIIGQFKHDYRDILNIYNELSGKNIALFSELKDLIHGITSYKEKNPDDDIEKLIQAFSSDLASIVMDADYSDWVSSFLPNEERNKFISKIASEYEIPRELISKAMLGLLHNAQTRGNKLIAQVLIQISMQLHSSRKECKTFMITLAAISSRLQSKNDNQSVSEIIKLISSEKYFSLDKEIR